MVDDQKFYAYFKENMKATGLYCPETLFEKLTTAVGNIVLLSTYVETNSGATVRQALKALGASLKTSGGTIGINTLIKRVALGTLKLAAAYYTGACIGSLFVAGTRSYSDFAVRVMDGNKAFTQSEFYSVADISRYTNRLGLKMGYVTQKTLHRYPELRRNHLSHLY